MKRYLLHSVIMIVASLAVGIVAGGSIVSVSNSRKKSKKSYAGKILCIPNPDTKEVDIYLQMLASTAELMQCDSVEFEVRVKEPGAKVRTTSYSA